MRRQLIAFSKKPMAKAPRMPIKADSPVTAQTVAAPPAVVMAFKPAAKKAVAVKASLRMPRQRQAIAVAR